MFRPQTLSSHRLVVVSIIGLAGVAATVGIWLNTVRQENARVAEEFQRRAIAQAHVAREQILLYPELLENLRTIGSFSNPVFRAMLGSSFRNLIRRHPAIAVMEWVPAVPQSERERFERRTTYQLGTPYVIRQKRPDNTWEPAPLADYYYPIQLAVPLEGNEQIIGYDIRNAPTAKFLEQARATRSLVATPQFRLAQANEPDDDLGTILIMPVFGQLLGEETDEFRGFIQCVFKIHEALAQLHQGVANDALLLYYEDASATGEERRVMYANLAGYEPPINNTTTFAPPPPSAPNDPHVVIETISIGGRDWRIVAMINPDWAADQRSAVGGVLLSGGLVITFILAYLVNTLLLRNREIERTVERRTADAIASRKLLEKDITRRVIAEKSLRESESLLRSVIDRSPSEIFIKDLRGRYTMFNEQYQRAMGRTAPEIFGKTDFELFPPEIAKKFTDEDKLIIETKTPQRYETELDISGKSRTDLVQKFPLLDADGKVYSICGVVTDISYRAAAEAERQRFERKLQASQHMESLGVLAGGVAHDFNNILTTILGHAGMIREKGGRVSDHYEQLKRIETAARRASDLCEQMLTYAGQGPHSLELIDLNDIVRDTVVLVAVSLGKNTEIPLELASHLHAARADSSQLRQVVMNLIINAADAIGDRPGNITLRTFERPYTAADLSQAIGNPDLPSGTYLGLEFIDNGCGIDAAEITRIFEPFFTTKFHGRGLGLSTVLGIVQGHQGALFLESQVGHGSTFRVLLPATDEYVASENTASPFAESPTLAGTAMVVDDEEAVLEVTVTALEMSGMTTVSARSGQEAIERYKAQPDSIDVVLLDMTMPGLSGADTLKILREINPALRAIILSGYSQKDAEAKMKQLRVDAFIQKPFELAVLVREVSALLTHRG